MSTFIERLGPYKTAVEATLADFAARQALRRLWDKDPSLWKTDPAHTAIIAHALGWLNVIDTVRPRAAELSQLGDQLFEAGYRHVVLMGMGGSSLCPEVLRRTHVPIAGYPELIVLDSTVPATIRRIEAAIDPNWTIFVVASKSGTTLEPSVFHAYFYEIVRRHKGDRAGENFLAITDPGTVLDRTARAQKFRLVVENPSDIGGRYSALSFFGMVPAGLMGLDVATFLDRAQVAVQACRTTEPIGHNPGARLGAILGTLARQGRDKLTLITSPPLEALGLWIEQLIAESTGKEGQGILPVAGEPLGSPDVYGPDRLFVHIRTADRPGLDHNPALQALVAAGHPLVEQVLGDVADLGAEFFRWEVATALAGLVLGIDPFDQPNVQESKDNTNALLAQFEQTGTLPEQEPLAWLEGVTLLADPGNRAQLLGDSSPGAGHAAAVAALRAHFARVKAGDYLAITQYIDERAERDAVLQEIRTHLRDTVRGAVTTGYGPRFLHSTGQLHKGGPATGVFLQITADDGADVPIPGKPYGFATLVTAQALGDFQALATRGRRALRVHLGSDVDGGLQTLRALIRAAVSA
jgi:transaldolase/glucose-6-phosphate isomerase